MPAVFRLVRRVHPGLRGGWQVRIIVLVIVKDRSVVGWAVSGGNIPDAVVRWQTGPAPTLAFGMGNLRDGNRLDGPVDDGIDALHGNTAIDDNAVVNVVIIDDGGLVEKLPHAFRFGAVIPRMRFGKVVQGNEGEGFRAQAKIKAYRHPRTAIKKSRARPIHRERRQRRPAAIVIM